MERLPVEPAITNRVREFTRLEVSRGKVESARLIARSKTRLSRLRPEPCAGKVKLAELAAVIAGADRTIPGPVAAAQRLGHGAADGGFVHGGRSLARTRNWPGDAIVWGRGRVASGQNASAVEAWSFL